MSVTHTRKQLEGVVVSDKMEKSAVIVVERFIQHKLYRKSIKQSKKYHFHDEKNECNVGDRVIIEECRPLSKNKFFKLVKIIEKNTKVQL